MGQNGDRPIIKLAYAIAQLEALKTWGRSSFYLITPKHLFNRKMKIKTVLILNYLKTLDIIS